MNQLLQYPVITTKDLKEPLVFNTREFIISNEKALLVIISSFCWFLVYGVVNFTVDVNLKTKKEINDTKNRIISCLHSSIGVTLCLYDYLFLQSVGFCSANSNFENYFICFTLGYFIYDLICCILLDLYDKELICHHLFCISGLSIQLVMDFYGMEAIRAYILSEVTNPIMHIRIILRTYGLKFTKLYLCLEFLYIVIYIIARGILAPIEVFNLLFNCLTKFIVYKFCAILLLLLSLYNIKKMFGILKLRYREMCERKIKNIELFWFEVDNNAQELNYKKKESFK